MVTGTQNCQRIFSQVAHETSSLNKKIVRPEFQLKLEFQLNLFKAHGKSGHIHICYRVLTFNFAFSVQINQV